MKPALRIAALLLSAAAAAAAFYLGRPSAAAFQPGRAEALLSIFLLAATATTAVAAFGGSVRLRIAAAASLFSIGGVLLFLGALHRWPLAVQPFTSDRYLWFLVGVHAAAIYGLLRRRLWARWLGLAFGGYGALSSGINAAWWLGHADHWCWTFLAFFFGSILVAINLLDPDVAETFLARSRHQSLWRSPDGLVRLTRWATIANLAAVSMLLVYAWMQPFVPSTAPSALALAGVLGVATVLLLQRKVAGGLLLGVGAIGLFAQTVVTALRGAAEPELVAYYVVFWMPAALLGGACGVRMLVRMITVTRR
jgi:hypothetical protein